MTLARWCAASACALWVVLGGAVSADPAGSLPPDRGAKPTVGVTTSGPPTALSAAQRAALAAKQAASITPARVSEPAPVKAAPISTLPAGAGAASLKVAPAVGPALAPAREPRPAPAYRRVEDRAAIEALIALLGPEAARRAGLVKSSAAPLR